MGGGYRGNVLSSLLFTCLKQREARHPDLPLSNGEEMARSIPIQLKGKKKFSFLFDVHNWTFNTVKASLKGFKPQ